MEEKHLLERHTRLVDEFQALLYKEERSSARNVRGELLETFYTDAVQPYVNTDGGLILLPVHASTCLGHDRKSNQAELNLLYFEIYFGKKILLE